MSGILFMFASTLIKTQLRTSLFVLRPCLCEGFFISNIFSPKTFILLGLKNYFTFFCFFICRIENNYYFCYTIKHKRYA